MTKAEILTRLDATVNERLFGDAGWHVGEAGELAALHGALTEMGLQEQVPGERDAFQATALGKEIDVELHMVFIGLWDYGNALEILLDRGFMDEDEFDRRSGLFENERSWAELKAVVQRAYRQHHGAGVRH
jgi:hypothetical protein